MRFDVVTVFPDLIESAVSYGVVGQALKDGRLSVHALNPRKHTHDVHQTVDDRPFGGGDGMILLAEPLARSLAEIREAGAAVAPEKRRTLFLSPRGRTFDDRWARDLAEMEQIVLICGRYGGVDQRFLTSEDIEEVSIGDYVLSGGELGALVIIDSVSRFLPGVLGNTDSPHDESFAQDLLEYPQFTRPREYEGLTVPEVLLSGHHKNIQTWRRLLSILVTAQQRPDLLTRAEVSRKEIEQAQRLLATMTEAERKACGLRDPENLGAVLGATLSATQQERRKS